MTIELYSQDIKCFRQDWVMRVRTDQIDALNGQLKAQFSQSNTAKYGLDSYIDDEGRYQKSTSYIKIPFAGSAPQHVTDREINLLPDGYQDKSIVRIYTQFDSPLFDSVLEHFNGDLYRVIKVDQRVSHTRIFAELIHGEL